MKTLQDLEVGDEVCHDYDQIRKIAKITQKRIYLEPRGSSGFMPVFNRQTGKKIPYDVWDPEYIWIPTEKDYKRISLDKWRDFAIKRRDQYSRESIKEWTENECKLFICYLDRFESERKIVE